MSILITGAAGFIGWNLARHFSQSGCDVIAGYHRTPPVAGIDVRWEQLSLDRENALETIIDLKPSAILHCAAVPGIAACNNKRKAAFNVNVLGSCRVAEAAGSLGIPLVYFSTDLVFDGMRGWYDEEDSPNPPTYYGETKLIGEQESLGLCPRTFVLRLALAYGQAHDGLGGFLKWTAEGILNGATLNLYNNQYRSILYTGDIAEVTQRLLERDDAYGIYHMGGPDRLNRFEIGRIFADRFFGTDGGIVSAILERGEGLGTMDDTSLITTKVRSITGHTFTGYRDGIEKLHSVYNTRIPSART